MSPASAKETHVRVGGSDLSLDQGPSWRRRDRPAEEAQAAGKAHMSQTVLAVQAAQRARPDMTASDALAAVNRYAKVMISWQT